MIIAIQFFEIGGNRHSKFIYFKSESVPNYLDLRSNSSIFLINGNLVIVSPPFHFDVFKRIAALDMKLASIKVLVKQLAPVAIADEDAENPTLLIIHRELKYQGGHDDYLKFLSSCINSLITMTSSFPGDFRRPPPCQ